MSAVDALFEQAQPFRAQPIENWNPDKTTDIDIRIHRDGTWHYRGSPIQRIRMVKLFATLLRREGEDFFLITPPVKYRISVEDSPFLAVEIESRETDSGPELWFRTNMDEVIRVEPEHPVFMRPGQSGEMLPYVTVKPGLDARLTRPVYYTLAEKIITRPVTESGSAAEAGREDIGVQSAGHFYVMDSV